MNKEEIEKNYNEFWKDIVEKEDGTIDIEQVKKELYDFSIVMGNCTNAYMKMTDGNISKPNTHFFEVINIFEEKYAYIEDYNELEEKVEQLENKVKELIERLEEDVEDNLENKETNVDGMEDYWRGCVDIEQEILSKLKGDMK